MSYLESLMQLLIAFALAIPIGWDRERRADNAGLRTFPLVAVGSCSFILMSVGVLDMEPLATARIIQGLMTGVGFIGGGAILKSKEDVHGTATAASIWNTGAIGAAVALGAYHLAVTLTVLNVLILWGIRPLKDKIREDCEAEES